MPSDHRRKLNHMQSHTEREIESQPEVWAATIDRFDPTGLMKEWSAMAPRRVLVTGCGSTFYLSLTAAALLRDVVGIPSRATPASEIVLGTNTIPDVGGTVLLAISRSGTTSETLAAVQRFRMMGGAGVVAVTNYPERTLGAEADIVLAAPDGQEESVAQTRSFSSMLLVVEAAVVSLAGIDRAPLDALPGILPGIMDQAREPMTRFGSDAGLRRFHFLGSDPLYGIASEGMLKLKEMSLTDSEAYHTLEYRHGPMSMADSEALVIGLISPDRSRAERAVVSDVSAFGANTIEIGVDMDISISAEIPGWARPVLYLPPLQILALERARSKSLNPDHPRNLAAVIELEDLGTSVSG
jgi:glucosamine--fructose-6-phosphate aminotransferase (isomerizing)